MPITDAQFKLLAQEYMFDINEAKSFLGISQPKKSQSTKEVKFPSTPSHIPYVSDSQFRKLSENTRTAKSTKSTNTLIKHDKSKAKQPPFGARVPGPGPGGCSALFLSCCIDVFIDFLDFLVFPSLPTPLRGQPPFS